VSTYAGADRVTHPGSLSSRLPTGEQRELRHRVLIHRHTFEFQRPLHINNVVRRPSKLLQTPSSTVFRIISRSRREFFAIVRYHYDHRYLSIRPLSCHTCSSADETVKLTGSIEYVTLRIADRVDARELKRGIDIIDLRRRIRGRWRRVPKVEMQDCPPIEESALLFFKVGFGVMRHVWSKNLRRVLPETCSAVQDSVQIGK